MTNFATTPPPYKPRKGFHGRHSDATKKKLSLLNKGKKLSLETRKKMSETRKRLGIRPYLPKGYRHSAETIEKIRKSNMGKVFSEERKKKMSLIAKKLGLRPPSRKGAKESIEIRKRKSIIFRGKGNPNWQNGLTPLNKCLREGLEYRLWRESVFKRDNWTCIWCKKRGGELEADHIKPFSLYPELRFAIDNGRTLCKDCHKTTETWGAKLYIYKKNL